MILSEDQKSRKEVEEALFKKWEPALNSSKYPSIKTDEMARTTAILMENYLQHVNSNVQLLAEDRISTGNIQGVNLALLGLIRRVIPELVGAELAGVQALPTPESPIFTLIWQRDYAKGSVAKGQKMWDTKNPYEFGPTELGEDAYYSSQIVKETVDATGNGVTNATTALNAKAFGWANTPADTLVGIIGQDRGQMFIYDGSVVVEVVDADTGVVYETWATQDTVNGLNKTAVFALAGPLVNGTPTSGLDAQAITALEANVDGSGIRTFDVATVVDPAVNADARKVNTVAVNLKFRVSYEYKVEDEQRAAELSFNIVKTNVEVKQRRLRGKFTLESSFDLKKLHGVSIENELVEQMKVEMMNGINREIVDDLRMMAEHVGTVNFASGNLGPLNITGNYDDMHKVLLDSIEYMAATIAVQGRLGHGNFLVVNPLTFSTLSRLPGFVGSGVNYDGKGLRYAGSLGGGIKIYQDVQYPKNEILIGYKGGTATDCGYIHAPYLPITPTPTIIDPDTGNPSKIFYTRYGKTFDRDRSTGLYKSAIDRGEKSYARLNLSSFPTAFPLGL